MQVAHFVRAGDVYPVVHLISVALGSRILAQEVHKLEVAVPKVEGVLFLHSQSPVVHVAGAIGIGGVIVAGTGLTRD